MTDTRILAIHTYGSQRVKHPTTQKMVSAYKIGYSSAAAKALLALYGEKARDVSPMQASYRYIQLDGETTVYHGYLLFCVTTEELARVEALTRQFQRAEVYVWQDNLVWLELPHGRSVAYEDARANGHGPGFNPAGLRAVSPATGDKRAAAEGIRAEKSQRSPNERPWWWLLGDTYPKRELLKRYGARFSGKRRAWYYAGWELPDEIKRLVTAYTLPEAEDSPLQNHDDAPCTDEEAERILGVKIAPVETGGIESVEAIQNDVSGAGDSTDTSDTLPSVKSDKPEPVRIFKPQPLPADGTPLDDIQTAIVGARQHVAPAFHSPVTQKRVLATIGQTCVGELTGSITGNVWCYGYAVHDGICVYVNMGGPRMAVEAIRSKLGKGDIVTCVPTDAPGVELTTGEGNTGMYHDFMQTLPEAKFTSLILCHDLLITPNYGGKSTTFLFRTDDAQAAAKLKHHITELVKVPVFDAWSGYLYHAGQTAMLVRPTLSAGGIDLLTIELDMDAWTRLITGGLEQGILALPDSH